MSPKFIYSIGKHAITIKNKQHLQLSINENPYFVLPVNVKAYSIQGEYLGLVKDYTISNKYEIESIILDNQQLISISDMASNSTSSIFIYDSQEHVNINSFRYRIKRNITQNPKVKVLPKLFSSFNKISPNPSKKENLIVGRICTKDILDTQNNVIVKQNSTITEQILALASNKNKLQELMKYSKIK